MRPYRQPIFGADRLGDDSILCLNLCVEICLDKLTPYCIKIVGLSNRMAVQLTATHPKMTVRTNINTEQTRSQREYIPIIVVEISTAASPPPV
jgi:hypothetical protein